MANRTAIVRMRFHEPTIAEGASRTAEGKSKRDIIRCLKRYVIREVHHLFKVNPRAGHIASCRIGSSDYSDAPKNESDSAGG